MTNLVVLVEKLLSIIFHTTEFYTVLNFIQFQHVRQVIIERVRYIMINV